MDRAIVPVARFVKRILQIDFGEAQPGLSARLIQLFILLGVLDGVTRFFLTGILKWRALRG